MSCYYIYIVKKNKPHFIILQNVDFVNRVLQAGIKKEDNCLPTYPYSITLRQNTYSLIKAINYLDKSIAGLEIVRGAALLLHLLKKTIFKIALYLYFPFYYTTNYNICQYGCGLRRSIFLIKTLNLLLKTPFYYTINHSFYQYSCSFKANLQLKSLFYRQNTHLFYTILLLFTKNYPQFSTFLHNFYYFSTIIILLLLYYYYIIIILLLLYYYIILLKSNA